MKKLILIFFFIPNLLLSADKFQTNVPNVYIKNFQCHQWTITFNLVNKSSETINKVSLVVFDSDGDPIDELPRLQSVKANSGKKIVMSKTEDCSNFSRVGFKVQ